MLVTALQLYLSLNKTACGCLFVYVTSQEVSSKLAASQELTGAIRKGGQAQYLDKLQVERERGITVKVACCSVLRFSCLSSPLTSKQAESRQAIPAYQTLVHQASPGLFAVVHRRRQRRWCTATGAKTTCSTSSTRPAMLVRVYAAAPSSSQWQFLCCCRVVTRVIAANSGSYYLRSTLLC